MTGLLAAIAFLVAVAALWWGRGTRSSPQLPVDRVLQRRGFADENRCVECHSEAEHFAATGHARTLEPANAKSSLATLKQFLQRPDSVAADVSLDLQPDVVWAAYSDGNRENRVQLDWCFGSGRHAKTWVGTMTDSWGATDLVEFRWTWYHAIEGFDITPGQPEEVSGSYFGGLGVLYDHPKTRRCFACHSSHLEVEDGFLDESAIHPGVTCQRCHGPRQKHIETEGEYREYTWRGISQEESVNRCGQCHRRADGMEPGEIRKDNKDIVRFQPVGLVQSPCFRASEMTCMTCHDPHTPIEQQNLQGIWQCTQCHDAAAGQFTCAAGLSDDCLSCHMPKVRSESPLDFTDHWIRVRTDSPNATEHAKSRAEIP